MTGPDPHPGETVLVRGILVAAQDPAGRLVVDLGGLRVAVPVGAVIPVEWEWWPPQDGDMVVDRLMSVWRYDGASSTWRTDAGPAPATSEGLWCEFGPIRLVWRDGRVVGR